MKNSMKVLLAVIVAIVVVVGAGGMWYANTYNSFVTLGNEVDNQWANVESKLQRRVDLIPNLVNSVKGIMKQETEVFGKLADARAKLAGAGTVNEKVEASTEVEGALSRLLVVMENYPELKSSENVSQLMDELAGTENRISVERDRYNETVKEYNNKIQRFPSSIIANSKGYEKREFFKAQPGSEVAPTVDFN
ncbi:MAG TPA: LemA family protein [Epulopiscium sp.]|nr:LemA family protein [Candidatus Epulonipiscium sp.]